MSNAKIIDGRFAIDHEDSKTLLGRGGMGSVYLGQDTLTNQPVAVKILNRETVTRNAEAVSRFEREGIALRQLNHPNIVKLLGVSEESNQHFLIMEYVSGGSLRDILDEQPRLSTQRVLYTALDLADALTRAHRLQILHRDIKPANVMIAEDGTPRLTDFGMALIGKSHVTQSGAIVGTLAYLSPEALNGEDVDERTDIWSFGVLLYEMLTGKNPFLKDQVGSTVSAILTQPVEDLETLRPDIPVGLIDLVYRMVEKDKYARIPSVRLVGAELEAIIRGPTTSMQRVVVVDTSSGRFDTTVTQSAASTTSRIIPPVNLPAQPTPFIGREEEIINLGVLLNNEDHRLLTIVGAGGVGKTRLAVEVATRQRMNFRDGVYFVPLAALDDHKMIAGAVAEALNFTFAGASEPEMQLINYLSEKEVLIILDNFEHMTEGAGFLSRILEGSANSTLVITSRERLRLRGEYVFDLDGMRLPDRSETPEMLLAFPIIQLFQQSARRVLPDFEINDETGRHVAEIGHLVGGLPLGVELAAGWLEMLSVDEIAGEIERSLDFLETDLRDVPERHRSLRAVFDYSWGLLEEEHQEAFMRLSVFRGGFEREAAQKVAGASLRTLTTLINKSLIRRLPSGRYEINKLVRQYAEDHFNRVIDSDQIRKEHAKYYADFLLRTNKAFNTHKEQNAVDAIETELPNIQAAWQCSLRRQDWNVLDTMLHPLTSFYQARSILREAVERYDLLAKALEAAGEHNSTTYWRARTHQGWIAQRLGEYDLVLEYSYKAHEYFKDRPELSCDDGYALNNISYCLMMLGEYDKSVDYGRMAKKLSEPMRKDLALWSLSLGNLGYAEFLRGNYQEAKRLYELILEKTEQIDYSPISRAFMLNNLGEIHRAQGDTAQAARLFEEAYNIFESYRHKRGIAFTSNNLAGIKYIMGQFDEAKILYEAGYKLNRTIGDQYGISESLSALGNLAYFVGQLEDAHEHFEQSLKLRTEIGNQRGIADSLTDLARVALSNGNFKAAEDYFERGVVLRRQIGDHHGEGMAIVGYGMALLMKGDERTIACEQFQKGLEIGHALNSDLLVAQALTGLGEVEYLNDNHEKALEYLIEALKVNAKTNYSVILMHQLATVAAIMGEMRNWDLALRLALAVERTTTSTIMIPITRDRALAVIQKAEENLVGAHIRGIELESQSQSINDLVLSIVEL